MRGYVMIGLMLSMLVTPCSVLAEPDSAPVLVPKVQSLPEFFKPGKSVSFVWWQGQATTSGIMIIDEVQNGWVRMHTNDNKLRGWIYPSTMNALWGPL